MLISGTYGDTSAQDRQWLSYEPTVVQLKGKLIVERKYGPPNYGENPQTDSRESVPILVLNNPVSARGKSGDELNSVSIQGLKRIQLSFFNLKTSYKPFVGKKVLVQGTLFHAITGHHHTKVVMELRSIKYLRD